MKQVVEEKSELRFVKPSVVAKALGLTRKTIYRLVDSGEIPHVRLGKTILIRRSWFDAQ